MKFAISAISNSNDGMSIHHITLARSLGQIGEVTLLPDTERVASKRLAQFDYIFRYGWPCNVATGYHDADFELNISEDKGKNILVAPFNMMMLHEEGVQQVKSRFEKIIYDSSFSKEHGDAVVTAKTAAYIHPRPGRAIYDNGDVINNSESLGSTYNFLHVSNGLYWIKGVDLIVSAFLKTFASKDNVTLTLVLKDQFGTFKYITERFARVSRSHQLRLIKNALPLNEMSKLYVDADCYVCASRYDTFSLPTLEAAIMGLRVVSHHKGGMRDYLPYLNPGQYIPLKTRPVTIPANIWRGNKMVDAWEPTPSSIERAFQLAYTSGKISKRVNDSLKVKFCEIDTSAHALKSVLV